MLRTLAALLLTLAAVPATAGDWQVLPDGDGFDTCTFRFTGPILPGDLTAIEAHPNWQAFRNRICLDSPGGSLKEVYDFVTENGAGVRADFATTVETGARCESACAILFMFGQSWGANSPYPDRILEPGARLGFHSPFLATAELSDDQREDAFRVALDVAKLLMDTSYKAVTSSGAPLSNELVSLVLNTPGDQMYHVDTIGEMAILGIDRPFEPDAGLRFGADRASVTPIIERICTSSFAMTYRRWLVDDGYDFTEIAGFVNDVLARSELTMETLVEIPAEGYEKTKVIGILTGPFSVPGWYSAGAALYCRAELRVDKGAGHYEIAGDNFSVNFGPLFDLDDNPLPAPDEYIEVFRAGLTPIDQKY